MPTRSSIYIELYTPAAEKSEALRMSLHTGGHRHGNDSKAVGESNDAHDERGNEGNVERPGTGVVHAAKVE